MKNVELKIKRQSLKILAFLFYANSGFSVPIGTENS